MVENRPGGASNIGARACADAPPDGYTLCIMPGEPLAYNQFLYKKLTFDPAKDFEPIVNLFFNTQALVVNAALNVRTVDELVALSKAKAGTLSYTAPSLPLSLYLERLKRERGADWVGIPFRGGGDTTNAVLSGSTPIAFLGMQNFISHLQAGTMTGLAVDGAQRSPLFPDIPTLAELGYRGNLTRVYFAPACARRHAQGDHQQDPRGCRPHRQRARLPQEAVHRPRARTDPGHAGGIRPFPHRGPRHLRARRHRSRAAAAVTGTKAHEPFLPAVRMAGGVRSVAADLRGGGAGLSDAARSRDRRPRAPAAPATSSCAALADELHKSLGQPFIVENRPGGAFNIGARACAEAPPDGYTLCIIPGEPLVFNQFLFKSLAFDPENGFEPITQLFFITQALVVSAALDVKTLPELVALSKAKPGTLSYSTAAVPLGVFIERLKKDTGADLVRVPFRGGGEAVTALLNGSTPVGFYGIANVRAQLEGGTVIGLLVDSDKRSPLFPDIPTIPEATQKTFAGRSYFGLLAPAEDAETDRRALGAGDRPHRRRTRISQSQPDRARARAGREYARRRSRASSGRTASPRSRSSRNPDCSRSSHGEESKRHEGIGRVRRRAAADRGGIRADRGAGVIPAGRCARSPRWCPEA